MKEIIIATKNKGKATEFKELFTKYGINAISLLDMTESLPDVKETGQTFKENASLKAVEISSILNKPVLADDSGLIIDALDGQPGIKSARYAGESKGDQENIDKVIRNMVGIPRHRRTARFICVLAVAIPGEKTIFRTGYCEGSISFVQKGTNGFGYDSIFIPKNDTRTMAEITTDEKSKISHRKKAMIQLDEWIINYQQ